MYQVVRSSFFLRICVIVCVLLLLDVVALVVLPQYLVLFSHLPFVFHHSHSLYLAGSDPLGGN
jgi:hypothetical protein